MSNYQTLVREYEQAREQHLKQKEIALDAAGKLYNGFRDWLGDDVEGNISFREDSEYLNGMWGMAYRLTVESVGVDGAFYASTERTTYQKAKGKVEGSWKASERFTTGKWSEPVFVDSVSLGRRTQVPG